MANKPHSYNSGRIHRAGRDGESAPAAPQQKMPPQNAPRQSMPQQTMRPSVFEDVTDAKGNWGDEYLPPPEKNIKKLKKRKRWPKVLVSLCLVLVLLGGVVLAATWYLGDVLDPGFLGTIVPFNDTPKAYSKKDVVHILILGIDNEEGRDYGAGLGLTDMILYARYDLKNNQLNLLQIPRDSYVGESYATGGTGKINALLISGANKDNPINNVTDAFWQMFRLPVDYYVALDMDGFKDIVNAFGGIKVYVSQDMEYGGSYLPQGWQWLDGDSAEFFVRNRKGDGFARGDIDRLDNQRHFYSALFRRFLNLTAGDVAKLLPVFDHYCNTDISLGDLISLGVAALNLKAENVTFCKAPGATGSDGWPADPTGAGRSVYYLDLYGRGTEEDPGLASILNTYFRGEGESVSASEFALPQDKIPDGVALYSPNIQGMAEVQAPEGGENVDVEPEH